MRKISIIICLLAVACITIPSSIYADGACDNLTIVHIGVKPSVASGVQMYLRNDLVDNDCTDFPLNGNIKTILDTDFPREMLSILLTASILSKKIWVYAYENSGELIISNIQVKNIAE